MRAFQKSLVQNVGSWVRVPFTELHPHSLHLSRSSGPGVTLGEILVFIDGDVLTLPSRSLRAGDRALPGASSSHQDTKVVGAGVGGGRTPESQMIPTKSWGEGSTARSPRKNCQGDRSSSCLPRTPIEVAGTEGGLAALQSPVLPAPPSGLKVFKGPEP